MDTIAMNIPFMLLSTQVNASGESERRFLTPFGTIDLVFRPVWERDSHDLQLEITLKGDTENWLLPEQTFSEFKQAIVAFVREMVHKHLERGGTDNFEALTVQMTGSEMSLRMPCPVASWSSNTTM